MPPADDETAATDSDGDIGSAGGVPVVAVLVLGTGLFGLGLTVGGYGAVVQVLVAAGASAGAAGAGTSAFLLGQAVVVLPADRLTRATSPRAVAGGGLAVAALGAAIVAEPTISGALASRTFVGLGQGAAFVAAMTHVGRRTTGSDTATSQGLLGAGFTLGFAVGLAVAPTAIETGGLAVPAAGSAAFVAIGAVGALTLPPTAHAGTGATASSSPESSADSYPSVSTYLDALREPTAATLALANAVTFGFLVVAGTWYAELLATASVPTTLLLVAFALATVLGRAVGGVLAARVGDTATVGWSLVGQAVVLGGTAVALATGHPVVAALGIVASGLGFGVPFGPLFALAFTEISPDPGVTLVGMLVVGNLAALVSPWFVGEALTATGSFAVGIGSMAVTVGVVALLWRRTVGFTALASAGTQASS